MGLFGPSGREKWKPENRLTEYFEEAAAKLQRDAAPVSAFANQTGEYDFLDAEQKERETIEAERRKKERIVMIMGGIIMAIGVATYQLGLWRLQPKEYGDKPARNRKTIQPSVSARPDSVQDLRNSLSEERQANETQRLYIDYLREKNAALAKEVRRLGGTAETADFKEFLGRPDEAREDLVPQSRRPSTEELRAKFRHQE